MSFRVEFSSLVRSQVAAWKMPDVLLVEVYLRFARDLTSDPAEHLVRTDSPFDGMTYAFSIVDPNNRLHEHRFAFWILYSQDEEKLIVTRGSHTFYTIQ